VRPRVAIVTNADWFFWSHRLAVARALRDAGCEVLVIAGEERGYGPRIKAEGFRFLPLSIARGSTNPRLELRTLRDLIAHYKREQPILVHHVAQKAVIYGSIAARVARIPAVINAVTGQGSIMRSSGMRGNVMRLLARAVYMLVFASERTRAIMQNAENLEALIAAGIVPRKRAVLIRGSGVDTKRFVPAPEPGGTPTILFASRLLWSKGLGELIDAMRLMRQRGIAARLLVVGSPDRENPECVPEAVVRNWETEGMIEWLGERDDMPSVFRQAHVVVLPSWDEGAPKVLLEAAASGLPIVTTDIPGCRQIVRDGVNGLLVPSRDPAAIARALERLITQPDLRARMGVMGRAIAVAEFDEAIIVEQTLAVYKELLPVEWPGRSDAPGCSEGSSSKFRDSV
jgi:glycosyltransferase involved in cell wall biosynthesis